VKGVPVSMQETYDAFGDRNVEYYTYNGTQTQPSPYLNFYNSNRASGFSYDNAGNLLSDGSNNYLYDAENRICAVQQLAPLSGTFGYVYAANGPLLGVGNLTSFTCDLTKNGMLTANGLALTNAYMAGPQGERLIEANGSFNFLHYNVFWEGKLLGTFAGTTAVQTNWHFALNDWLGTKRVTTTSTGANWTSSFSGPFGDFQSQTGTGSDPSEEHFTSKPRDTNSGLDYFGARHYNSNMGRFVSPDYNDTVDDPEPVPYADLRNPQSLNLYGYAGNNPLSKTDPDGHFMLTMQNNCWCDQAAQDLMTLWYRAQWNWLRRKVGLGVRCGPKFSETSCNLLRGGRT
jgi:RHS repeat-associated protein